MQAVKALLTAVPVLVLASYTMAHPPELLARLDADGDGAVSRAEFDARRHGAPPRLLGRADADGDGRVTRDEWRAALEEGMQQREH